MNADEYVLGSLHVNSFYELVDRVCKRPAMIALSGSLFEIAAFLDGCAAGLAVADKCYVNEWRGFRLWIAGRLHFERNLAWPCALSRAYPDDNEAIKQLPILFKEYLDGEAKSKSLDH